MAAKPLTAAEVETLAHYLASLTPTAPRPR